jgi:topoisomerase-4 subunit A
LEILGGLLVVYLNLDRVIEIIRNEDDAKAVLISEFNLTEVQAEAILNTKLRSLRKLEEMEIKKEDKALRAEKKQLKELLASNDLQNDQIKSWFNDIKKTFGKNTPLGRRKSEFTDTSDEEIVKVEDFIEKEPRTIILSKMGWIRAASGHLDLENIDAKYKEGDEFLTAFHATTTDKINVFASSGKMYSLAANDLPGARGFGESLRLMIDLNAEDEIISAFVLDTAAKYLLINRRAHGFIVAGENSVASTRNGKQIITTDAKTTAAIIRKVDGDLVAIVGSNDKLLIIKADEVPEMVRGKGVILQKYKEEKTYVMDALVFNKKDGLSWTTGRGTTTLGDIKPWVAARASQGQTVPVGFPRSGKFNTKQ